MTKDISLKIRAMTQMVEANELVGKCFELVNKGVDNPYPFVYLQAIESNRISSSYDA